MRPGLVLTALVASMLAVGSSAAGTEREGQRPSTLQRPAVLRDPATRGLGRFGSGSSASGSFRSSGFTRFGRVLTRPQEPRRAPTYSRGLMSKIFHAVRFAKHDGTIPVALAAAEAHVEAKALIGGPEGFTRMADLIANAKHEVLLETYFWQKSEAGDKLLGALPKLQENLKRDPSWSGKPVEVRLLINDVHIPGVRLATAVGAKLAGSLVKKANADGSVRGALAKELAGLHLDPRYVKVTVATHGTKLLGSLHSKTLSVDAHTVVVTGMNVQRANDPVDADGAPKPYAMDAGFVFHGSGIGAAVRADFEHGWTASTGEALPQPPPPVADDGQAHGPKTPLLVVTRRGDGNPFSRRLENPHNQAFLAATNNATDVIRIMTPNLNERALRDSIVDAVKRGTTVKLMLGKGFNEMAERFSGGTNGQTVKRLFKALDDAGVKNPEERFQVRWYSHDGHTPAEGEGSAHVKYYSFDGKVAIVGSGNMDRQSFRRSQELNVVVDSADVTKTWDAQVFEPAFARATPVTSAK